MPRPVDVGEGAGNPGARRRRPERGGSGSDGGQPEQPPQGGEAPRAPRAEGVAPAPIAERHLRGHVALHVEEAVRVHPRHPTCGPESWARKEAISVTAWPTYAWRQAATS